MLKKLLRFTVIGASVLALVACGDQQGAGSMSQNRYGTNSVNGYGAHNNSNIRLNREAARAVERIDGISRANVVVGDANAYVAVELNRNGTGTQGNGSGNMQGLHTRNGTAGTDTGFIGGVNTRGMTNQGGMWSSSITDNGTHGAGGNAYDGRSGRVGVNRTGILGANNVGDSTVRDNSRDGNYMYNGGAYGRTNTRGTNANTGIDPQLQAKIQSTVRQVIPNVRHVYVSAEQNFVERMGTYGDRFNGDRPMRNLITEFNAFVGDIFGVNRYGVDDRYNVRNRNGSTQEMNNNTLR